MYNIAVIGGSTEHGEACDSAYKTGKLLAQKGAVIINGGGPGVMECVSRGAKESGGTVIGILPGIRAERGNKYLSVALPTGIGYARNFLIIRSADAVIAFQGSSGTHSEVAFAITEGKSVVSMGNFSMINPKKGDGKVIPAAEPGEAVEKALAEAKRQRETQKERTDWEEFD